MKNRKVIVIGSGFAGLSVASNLAKAGFDVLIFEKNESIGGRARQFKAKGFTFDMGPSWYWMPDVFEDYFAQFGKKVSDYYSLERLDPSYSVFFHDSRMDIPADFEALCALFESMEQGSSAKLKAFLKEAQFKYEAGMNEFVFKPGLSIMEFASWKVVSASFRLQLLSDMASHVRKYFKNRKLIELLEFPVLFLGAMPSKTPALYSLMNYADIKLGTWFPKGGMYQIVEGMGKLARSLGVEIKTNSPVDKIIVEGGRATGVNVGSEFFAADLIVSGADYHHTETQLLPPEFQSYSKKYWDTRTMAPSSLLYYVGLNKKVEGLEHHNLFFDADFTKHAREIYEEPAWPENPLFYVSVTSKTDRNTAPDDGENLFILIPTAPGLVEQPEIQEEYFNLVMDRLDAKLEQNLRDHVVYRRDFACSDFMSEYNSFKGNAYGLANTLAQTAVLKPSIKSKKVSNLYFTGQLTVPGPGVPPSLISGRIVAREICKTESV